MSSNEDERRDYSEATAETEDEFGGEEPTGSSGRSSSPTGPEIDDVEPEQTGGSGGGRNGGGGSTGGGGGAGGATPSDQSQSRDYASATPETQDQYGGPRPTTRVDPNRTSPTGPQVDQAEQLRDERERRRERREDIGGRANYNEATRRNRSDYGGNIDGFVPPATPGPTEGDIDAERSVTFDRTAPGELTEGQQRNLINRAAGDANGGEIYLAPTRDGGTTTYVGPDAQEAARRARDKFGPDDGGSFRSSPTGPEIDEVEGGVQGDDVGIEGEDSQRGRQASAAEQQFLAETPGLDRRDQVYVTEEGELELTEEGEQALRRRQVAEAVSEQTELDATGSDANVVVREQDIRQTDDGVELTEEAQERLKVAQLAAEAGVSTRTIDLTDPSGGVPEESAREAITQAVATREEGVGQDDVTIEDTGEERGLERYEVRVDRERPDQTTEETQQGPVRENLEQLSESEGLLGAGAQANLDAADYLEGLRDRSEQRVSPTIEMAVSSDDQRQDAARAEAFLEDRAQQGNLAARTYFGGELFQRFGSDVSRGVQDLNPIQGAGPRIGFGPAESRPVGTQLGQGAGMIAGGIPFLAGQVAQAPIATGGIASEVASGSGGEVAGRTAGTTGEATVDTAEYFAGNPVAGATLAAPTGARGAGRAVGRTASRGRQAAEFVAKADADTILSTARARGRAAASRARNRARGRRSEDPLPARNDIRQEPSYTLDAASVDQARGVTGPSRTARVRGAARRTLESTRQRAEPVAETARRLLGDERGQLQPPRQRSQTSQQRSSRPEVSEFEPSRSEILEGSPRDRISSDVAQRSLQQRRQTQGTYEGAADPVAGNRRGPTIDPTRTAEQTQARTIDRTVVRTQQEPTLTPLNPTVTETEQENRSEVDLNGSEGTDGVVATDTAAVTETLDRVEEAQESQVQQDEVDLDRQEEDLDLSGIGGGDSALSLSQTPSLSSQQVAGREVTPGERTGQRSRGGTSDILRDRPGNRTSQDRGVRSDTQQRPRSGQQPRGRIGSGLDTRTRDIFDWPGDPSATSSTPRRPGRPNRTRQPRRRSNQSDATDILEDETGAGYIDDVFATGIASAEDVLGGRQREEEDDLSSLFGSNGLL